jgi:glycosyltransferase involved in cell wall biosynthesis
MLKVLAFTGGRDVPSARFRVRQHIPSLAAMGVEVRESYPLLGSYPPKGLPRRVLWAPVTLADCAVSALRSWSADVTWLQREMMSTLVTAERLTRRPRVLDVDDAIFLHRGGVTAKRLAALSDLVICGNSYLADVFGSWNREVQLLPTAVDTSRFTPAPLPDDGCDRIGWSGTSSGFPYLYAIAPALAAVLSNWPRARVSVIADRAPTIPGIPPGRVEFVRWSESNEVAALQRLRAGLMPLEDTPWSRGKCSFKLLTYMACGIPAVASPVGMNCEVLSGGGGLSARSIAEWADAIDFLLSDSGAAARIGTLGLETVRTRYSSDVIGPRLAELLRRCA